MRRELVKLTQAGALAGVCLTAGAEAPADPRQAVEAVVERAYVQGVHAAFDPAAMRSGFHPDFNMLVLREGKLERVTLEAWIERMEKFKSSKPDAPKPRIAHRFTHTDVAGHAATVRVEIERDGRHVFSDYLSLYHFPDGWKIVSKIFYAYPSQP